MVGVEAKFKYNQGKLYIAPQFFHVDDLSETEVSMIIIERQNDYLAQKCVKFP